MIMHDVMSIQNSEYMSDIRYIPRHDKPPWIFSKSFRYSTFHVQYANIEVTLIAWTTNTLLKTVVFGDLAPHQMFRFYHEFGITYLTTWSNLSFDPAISIFSAMKAEDIQIQIDPLASIFQFQILTLVSNDAPVHASNVTSRPKKKRTVI